MKQIFFLNLINPLELYVFVKETNAIFSFLTKFTKSIKITKEIQTSQPHWN